MCCPIQRSPSPRHPCPRPAPQVRDGAGHKSDPRTCLRTLRHRFLVCIGQQAACPASGEPSYVRLPLVVEPRFREQFVIANPSPQYEAMLMVRAPPGG